MTGGTFHEVGAIVPWRKVCFFAALSASDFVKQTALAAFGSIALFGFNIAVLAQVRNRPFYGGQRHGEIFRYTLFGRPALTVRICSVAEIHIKRNCSARKIVAVNGIEITHGSSSGRGAL